MGRILSLGDSLCDKTEAVCELIGVQLFRLAARTCHERGLTG
jgi:hypothetical protein